MTSVLGLVRTPVRRSALFMSVIGCVGLVAAIANSAASVGFPVGARWERVVNALVTVDLLVMVVVLVVAAVLTSRSAASPVDPAGVVIDQRGAERAERPRLGVLAVLGLALLAADWVLWLVFGLPSLIRGAVASSASYLDATIAAAFFGPLWVLGTIFAVVGFHRGGGVRNRRLSLVGAVLTVSMMGVVVLLAMLFAAAVIR